MRDVGGRTFGPLRFEVFAIGAVSVTRTVPKQFSSKRSVPIAQSEFTSVPITQSEAAQSS